MRALLLCCLCASSLFAQQHLKETFSPLKSEGTLPGIFTMEFRPAVQKELDALKKEGKKEEMETTLATYGKLATMVKSGNALVNGEVTGYLNQLLDVLLKEKPELRSSIHVYAFKSPLVNTYSFKGNIFINIGMIAQAETEAQLAYILAREIAHYTRKHVPTERSQSSKAIDDAYDYGKDVEALITETFGYSKEDEGDADLEAYSLYKQSHYSLEQPVKVFDLLQYSHLPFELVEFKKTFFEAEHYRFPSAYFLKEVAPIASKINTDDLESAHPNINKRKMAVSALAGSESNAGRVNAIVSEPRFMYVRDLARFELCRLFLRNRNYPDALYAAYALSKSYPGNEYLAEVISKCLYGIAMYRNGKVEYYFNSALPSGPVSYKDVESYPQQVYYFMETMPKNEWAILALNYSYRAHQKFPANRSMATVTDSLFALMKNIEWGIPDFIRTNVKEEPVVESSSEPKSKTELIANIQKEKNAKFIDTIYYKDVYLDLFMNDPVFTKKFPSATPVYVAVDAKKKPVEKDIVHIKADTLLLVSPFYDAVNLRNGTEVVEQPFNPKEESLAKTAKTVADNMKFKSAIPLDPGAMGAGDVEKYNDYSVLTDWLFENNDINDKLSSLVLNTNEAAALAGKYHTPYVLKLGFVGMHGHKGGVIVYNIIYDLRKNTVVYGRREKVNSSDDKTVMSSKVYQVFNELKYYKLVAD